MKHRLAPALAALLLAACTGNGIGPIYPVQDALYDWVKAPEATDPLSDRAPVIADPVVVFHLAPGDRRSALRAGHDWRLGHNYLFGFDIRLDRKSFSGQAVTLSRLLRRGDPATEIAAVQLDARGVTILGRTCIPSSELGNWHRVEMRIRLADNDAGFLEVFCDRRPLWARSRIRTTQPPICRRRDGCDTEVPKPVRFEWQLGLIPEERIKRGVEVQMQRIHFRRLYVIPNRVDHL